MIPETGQDVVYRIVTERILACLDRGVVPWRRPWSEAWAAPKNLVSRKPYRGANVMLLGAQAYASPWWATYKQITGELGGRVKGGSKGTPVVFYATGKKSPKGSPKASPKKPAAPAAPGKDPGRYFVLRYYTVFNVEQCEWSDPSVVPDHAPSPPRHLERLEACERIVRSYEGGPALEEGGSRACYSLSRDVVSLPPRSAFDMAEERYATLFHELAHSTGHPSRIGRDLSTTFGDHAYSFEELVAELGAAFLCGKAGIDAATVENSAAYLDHWRRKLAAEPRWMVKAAAAAAKAADWIQGVRSGKDERREGSEAA